MYELRGDFNFAKWIRKSFKLNVNERFRLEKKQGCNLPSRTIIAREYYFTESELMDNFNNPMPELLELLLMNYFDIVKVSNNSNTYYNNEANDAEDTDNVEDTEYKVEDEEDKFGDVLRKAVANSIIPLRQKELERLKSRMNDRAMLGETCIDIPDFRMDFPNLAKNEYIQKWCKENDVRLDNDSKRCTLSWE